MRKFPFVRSVEPGEGQIQFELEDAEKDRPKLIESIVAAGGQVMGVSEEQHSLEDVYLNLVRENKNGK